MDRGLVPQIASERVMRRDFVYRKCMSMRNEKHGQYLRLPKSECNVILRLEGYGGEKRDIWN